MFFPTCQVRVVRFYVSCLLLSSSPLLLLLNRDPRRTVFSVGPQPRPSTPSVPCRTSTTTIPAQCSLPDLNHDHPRPVFPAGPQPRVSTPRDNVIPICFFFDPYFPTCQVRVVRFHHSCSPPPPPPPHHPPPSPPPPSPPASPPPPLHPLPCPLPPCQLFANFRMQWALLDLNCRPPCQLFANFRMQWALLDLNCRRAIGVGTAGPQPGTFRAQ